MGYRFFGLLLTWTLMLGVLTLLSASGLRWNASQSMPRGLWYRTGAFDATRDRGGVVLFCPPPTPLFLEARRRGYLPWGRCVGGLAPLLKPVVALPGDEVQLGVQVRVNGEPLAGSLWLAKDGRGRPLPRPPDGVVLPGYVWVVSSHHAGSFDSRYFGAIATRQIEGVMQPLWLWRHESVPNHRHPATTSQRSTVDVCSNP
jgi:conjugative transfer signal peptidase TraF